MPIKRWFVDDTFFLKILLFSININKQNYNQQVPKILNRSGGNKNIKVTKSNVMQM